MNGFGVAKLTTICALKNAICTPLGIGANLGILWWVRLKLFGAR